MATERTDSAAAVTDLHRRSAAERIHETVRYLLRSWELYVFVLPAINPYPEHTMAFVDRFYTLDNSVQAQYGPVGSS